MQIVYYPHPALRWKSKPLKRIDAEVERIVRDMFNLMYEAEGVGLAANQVALPYRLFVLNTTADRTKTDEERVFINPAIVSRKGSIEAEEGCLSVPRLYAKVRRAKTITVEAFDLAGNEFRVELEGLASRAVQHESDHLDGVLFIDRVSELDRRELEPRLRDFESQYRRQLELGAAAPEAQIKEQLEELEALRT